jgi:hypothetical protein
MTSCNFNPGTWPGTWPAIWHGIKVAAFATVVGPLIGTLIVMCFVALRVALTEWASPSGPSIAESVQSAFGVAGFIVLFGYVFGGLPALIAGLMLGGRVATERPVSMTFTLLAALAALIPTGLVMYVLFFRDGPEPTGNVFAVIAFLLPLTVVSALICRYLMLRIGILPPAMATSLAEH